MNVEIKDKEQLKNVIKVRMRELQVSQYKLSKLTKIPESTLSYYLSDKHTLGFEKVLAVCKALEIKLNFNKNK